MSAIGLRPVRYAGAALALAIFLAPGHAAFAGEGGLSEIATRGRDALETHCGECHAIDTTDESPTAGATPLREIYAWSPPRALEEQLRNGEIPRHKDVRPIAFSDEDVEAILTYLSGLGVAPKP